MLLIQTMTRFTRHELVERHRIHAPNQIAYARGTEKMCAESILHSLVKLRGDMPR